jgi:hypothetical protein
MHYVLFAIFFIASFLGLMKIFTFTTYHKSFLFSLPFLIAYAVLLGYLFIFLKLFAFFLYQLIASVFFLSLLYRREQLAGMLPELHVRQGYASEEMKLMYKSIKKTQRLFVVSSFIYIAVFSITFLMLYNGEGSLYLL